MTDKIDERGEELPWGEPGFDFIGRRRAWLHSLRRRNRGIA